MARDRIEWPAWWDWELDLTLDHLIERIKSRSFSETDLREMLQDASGYHEDVEPGRYIIETQRQGNSWEVVVEPDFSNQILLIITAYKRQKPEQ